MRPSTRSNRPLRLLALFLVVCGGSNASGGLVADPIAAVIPTFTPTGLLDVVFFDNVTNTNTTVTPGLSMTREREFGCDNDVGN